MGDTFDALVEEKYRLEDMEVDALLPTLLEKSGQAKERFRVAIRALLTKIPLLCSYAKYSPLLLQVSFNTNAPSRVLCFPGRMHPILSYVTYRFLALRRRRNPNVL